MNLEDAIAAIAAATPLSEADVRGVAACAPDELAALVAMYQRQGTTPTRSPWATFLSIAGECLELAAIVTPLGTAIETVYGVAKL